MGSTDRPQPKPGWFCSWGRKAEAVRQMMRATYDHLRCYVALQNDVAGGLEKVMV